MKLTKYEYNHHAEANHSRSTYSSPLLRIIEIVLINIIILSLPIWLFCISFPKKYNFLGVIVFCAIVDCFLIEYNPLRLINFIHYCFFWIFGKNDIYKTLIKELRDYQNILEYEKRLNISNLRTSCFNAKVIIFNIKKKGIKKCKICYKKMIYITSSNKKIIYKYSINDFINLNDFFKYIKKTNKSIVLD